MASILVGVAAGAQTPVIASDNIELVGTFPGTTGGATGSAPPLAETGAAPLAVVGALGAFALVVGLRRVR